MIRVGVDVGGTFTDIILENKIPQCRESEQSFITQLTISDISQVNKLCNLEIEFDVMFAC